MSTAQINWRIGFAIALSLFVHAMIAIPLLCSWQVIAKEARQSRFSMRLDRFAGLAKTKHHHRSTKQSRNTTGSPRVARDDDSFGQVTRDVETIGSSPGHDSPSATHIVKPIYTDRARRKGIEGKIILEILVGVDGRVKHAKIKQGLGYGLDESSLAAILQSTFETSKDSSGKPRERWLVHTFRFQLLNTPSEKPT